MVTMKGVARQEYKDKLNRLPGVKNFIVLTGRGHNYCNNGIKEMKHYTTERKWIGQHKHSLLDVSQRCAFLCVLNIDPPIIKLWTFQKSFLKHKVLERERQTDRGINQRSRPVDSKLKTVPSLLKVSVQMFWGMGCIFVVAVCLHTDFERKCAAEDVNHCQKPKVLNTSPYFSPYLKTHMAILG